MSWNSAADFFAMGGYGLYVWGSVGVTVAALILELFVLGQRRKSALSRIKRASTTERNDDNEKQT
ncbi:MAG: heme exporter protein CcmD [Pusillimonas sp.]|jgi:heme exporter protein D|uniref:Heme exporter protein D n=1 Tax=Neopusillimonas maritima TaxID=2026239 RepID=A0A3A1YUJ7_9BURK|nr:heme exporter protein CcmD [Neopusillimonas maritima]MAO52702.1 heme exporter protein CcmD [Pusillimonas sp.]MBC42590.1 heme exporter protein CcmD [Pusillimonas sp.]MBC7203686.1 heme exporter protein CcmD [Pusillimonas sp.]MBF22778.1 heme exporter protein CcmD [Pusillimonas sp.]RIY39747.1 heme exporter protein CcmD [Neopusillimonas maritima]|tara:strand:- start:327 stop:521 length:195 start_codon:yes stop_codon:yes gene_type:complete